MGLELEMSSCAAICSLLLELQIERQKSVSQSVCSRFSVSLPPLPQKILGDGGVEVFVATL